MSDMTFQAQNKHIHIAVNIVHFKNSGRTN